MASHKIVHSWIRLSPTLRKGFVLYAKGLYGRYKLPQMLLQIFTELSDEVLDASNTAMLHQLVREKRPTFSSTHKNLLNSLSDLNNWLHEFLVLDYLKKPEQKSDYDILRLKALAQQKLSLEFNRVNNRLSKRFEEQEYRNTDTYLQLFQLRQIQIETPWSDVLSASNARPTDDMLAYLERYYMNFKLKLGLEMTNRNKLLNEQHDIDGFEEMKAKAAPLAADDIIVRGYLLCIRIIEDWQEEDYKQLHALLLESADLPLPNQLDFLQVLLNYCYRKMREIKNREKYDRVCFDLLKLGLVRKVLTFKGYIYHSHFRSVVILACRVGEASWAFEFIHKYKKYLTEEMKDVEQVSLATLFFHTKKYEELCLFLSNTKYKNVFMEFSCRAYQLKAQYELGWRGEIFKGQVTTFKKFLERKGQLNESYKIRGFDFAKCLLYLSNKKCNVAQMQEFLREKLPYGQEKWLLEKAKENEINTGSNELYCPHS